MRMTWARAFAIVVLCLSACDCADDPAQRGGPCDGATPPAFCALTCDADNLCPAGSYCAGTMCTADCLPSGGCAVGQTCSTDGRCLGTPASDGGDGSVCANVSLVARPVTPNVVIIVDQSGSMTSDFAGGVDRWNALRNALLATPDGLIASLESQVRFGLALYSGTEGAPQCPLLTEVDFALDNYAAIAAAYNAADPIDETPTGDAIDAVLNRIQNTPDPSPDPTIFIVATDGEPDRCEEFNPQNGQGEAIAAVTRAFEAGVRTFIVSVGEGVVSQQHLQDMANTGLGRGATDPDAEFWVAGDEQGLTSALADIVGGVLNCDVFLEGRIDVATACSGTVQLNGRALTCEDPNGWRPVTENRIQILGTACDELQNEDGAILEAEFPCSVILI